MHSIRSIKLLFFLPVFLCAYTGYASSKFTFSYGSNKDYAGQTIDIKADLYKPNLSSSGLPLVIIYHGGGYASGDRNMAVLKLFVDYFNAANISAVVPDFRQGWYDAQKGLCESATPENIEDAAYRAYQDNRALIRYCKANATLMGIDSTKIFLFGISSGGFIVLHNLYFDESLSTADRVSRLGKLDFQDNSYTNSTDVAGIISVVGGFYKNQIPLLKTTPVLLFNNTCDVAVDFFNGWLGNCSNTVQTYGPGIFTKILEQYNNPYSLQVFCGYTHAFVTENSVAEGDLSVMNYIGNKSIDFVKQIAQHTYTFSTQIASDSLSAIPLGNCNNFETFYWCKKDSIEVGNEAINISPNPILCLLSPKLNIRHTINETLYIEVIDELGKLISKQKTDYTTSQNVIYLNVNDFSIGINILLVKNSAGKVLYKTKVMRYCEF